ncbi:MAG TPA: hypothetical protein VIJ31_12160 [Acidothermaceae bacterium]
MTTPPVPVIARRHRAITTAFVVLSCVVLALAVFGALVIAHLAAKPFDPLYFPGQHVASATVHVGQDVTVTATRCNRSSKPVVYHAVKEWVSVDPPGSTVPVGDTSATEAPGCTNFTFKDPMPPLVVSRTNGLLSTGLKSVTWRIAAVDTPEGHNRPVTVSWATTPIVVTAK